MSNPINTNMNNEATNTLYLMQDGELKSINDFEFAKFLYVRLFGRMMSIDCFDCAECGRKEWRIVGFAKNPIVAVDMC